MIKNGTTKEELLQSLEELDNMSSSVSIVKQDKDLYIRAKRDKGKVIQWSLGTTNENFRSSSEKKTGCKYDEFLKALDGQNQEMELSIYDLYVLCYLDTKPEKQNGKISSRWFVLPPVEPYVMNEGQPVFQTTEFLLSEGDYKAMMETRIAFSYDGILYPLRQEAIYSVGRCLDSQGAFRSSDVHPLGSAILLAERISQEDCISILCRSRNKRVRPVVSVMGKRYVPYSQKLFFEKAFEALAAFGCYHLRKWTVTDEYSDAEVLLKTSADYEQGVFLHCGDVLGDSIRVTAFAKIGQGYLYLDSRSVPHTAGGIDNGKGIDNLFNGLDKIFDEFGAEYASMDGKQISYSGKLPKRISDALGTRRIKELDLPHKGTYPAKELFLELMQKTSVKLPEKQEYELRSRMYTVIFKNLIR